MKIMHIYVNANEVQIPKDEEILIYQKNNMIALEEKYKVKKRERIAKKHDLRRYEVEQKRFFSFIENYAKYHCIIREINFMNDIHTHYKDIIRHLAVKDYESLFKLINKERYIYHNDIRSIAFTYLGEPKPLIQAERARGELKIKGVVNVEVSEMGCIEIDTDDVNLAVEVLKSKGIEMLFNIV